jgi:hypothetical protein
MPLERYPGSTVVACAFSTVHNRWDEPQPGYSPPFYESADIKHSWADPTADMFVHVVMLQDLYCFICKLLLSSLGAVIRYDMPIITFSRCISCSGISVMQILLSSLGTFTFGRCILCSAISFSKLLARHACSWKLFGFIYMQTLCYTQRF